MAVSVYQICKTKNYSSTEEYEIKTHKIAAMCFDLCFCVYFGDLGLVKVMFSK